MPRISAMSAARQLIILSKKRVVFYGCNKPLGIFSSSTVLCDRSVQDKTTCKYCKKKCNMYYFPHLTTVGIQHCSLVPDYDYWYLDFKPTNWQFCELWWMKIWTLAELSAVLSPFPQNICASVSVRLMNFPWISTVTCN